MTYVTESRDALAQAIRIVDGNHDLGAAALADALIESGAVVGADTLAGDEVLRAKIASTARTYQHEVRFVLRALSAALSERRRV